MLTFKAGQEVTFNSRARTMLKKDDKTHVVKSVKSIADPTNPRYDTYVRNAGHTQFVTLEGDNRTYSGAHFDLHVGTIVLGR